MNDSTNLEGAEQMAGAPALSDDELMQAIIGRDQSALNTLYARYRPLLGKIVQEILPNEADAEEALQDVFIDVWARASNFDARKGKPLGWIICMARRRAIDRYRKIRRRAEASEKLRLEAGGGEMNSSSGERQMIAVSKTTEDTAVLSDLRRFLMQIVGTLPQEQERVIHLSYFSQLSQREIASRTGIPLGTIKTRLDLALRKLGQKSMQFREELYYAQ